MWSHWLTPDERAECKRLGLDCNFNPVVPTGGVDSAWRVGDKTFCFCDNSKDRREAVVYLCVDRKKESVGVDDDTLDRIWFIRRVCQRIADAGGCQTPTIASDAEKEEVVRRYQDGQTVTTIFRHLNRDRSTILRWLKEAGVWSEKPRFYPTGSKSDQPWTYPETERLLELREQGKSFPEIAVALERTHGSVRSQHSRLMRKRKQR